MPTSEPSQTVAHSHEPTHLHSLPHPQASTQVHHTPPDPNEGHDSQTTHADLNHPTTQNQQLIIPEPPPNTNPNPVSVYLMVTCFRVGTNHPTKRLNLHVSSISLLPKSYRDAFNDPNWQNAMNDEYHALNKNNTWTLVPRPTNANIVRSSSQALLQQIITSLHQEFFMTDLGSLNYFLGISVTRDSSRLFLSQNKYVVEILERAHMVNCNPSRTPVDTEFKLVDDGDPVSDPTLYRSLAGSLQYPTFTRPDISYAVQQLFASFTTSLIAYSDADWAGYPTTWRLTSGYCSIAVLPMLLLRHVGYETYFNPVQHQRTKHIEIDIHFVRDLVPTGEVQVLHVPSRYLYADIFTKGLPSALFEEFRTSLTV
ncbi:ribonuclease H-like domain-containing protein [Tanacetum coccineum]